MADWLAQKAAPGGIRKCETINGVAGIDERGQLGLPWMKAELFRFGASGLLNDIERQLEHHVTGRFRRTIAILLRSSFGWDAQAITPAPTLMSIAGKICCYGLRAGAGRRERGA